VNPKQDFEIGCGYIVFVPMHGRKTIIPNLSLYRARLGVIVCS